MTSVLIDATSYAHWEPLRPDDPEQMVGGSERCLIELARGLAKRHLVTVAASVQRPGFYGGALWVPADGINGWKADVAIVHGQPQASYPFYECKRTIHWSNGLDVAVEADAWVTMSDYHREGFIDRHGLAPEKVHVIPLGVDHERYAGESAKVAGRVIYCSSPDRGLHHLLRIWPKVKEAVPHAELHVTYDVRRWCEAARWSNYIEGDIAWQILSGLDAPGVVLRENLPTSELVREQMEAEVLCYPFDPLRIGTELFCLAALECAAADCALLLSDGEAVGEVHALGAALLRLPVRDEAWVEALTRVLTDGEHRAMLRAKARAHAEKYSWVRMVEQFDALIERVVAEREPEAALVEA